MEQKPWICPDCSVVELDNERAASGKNLVVHQNPKKAGIKNSAFSFLYL
jgi:hypothetical protein